METLDRYFVQYSKDNLICQYLWIAKAGVHHFWKRPLPASIVFATTELTQIAGTFWRITEFL